MVGVRRPYLDGLRGVAALVVLIGHASITFLYPMVTLSGDPHRWLVKIGASPLGLLWNGNSAVCVFFALSGFVMAQMTEGAKVPFLALAVRRYVRLALPILISSTFAYLLLRFSLLRNLEAGRILDSGWLQVWYQFAPSGRTMLEEALWGTFQRGAASYNSNLWTMGTELLGSLWIMVVWRLARSRTERLTALALLALLHFNDYTIMFAVGAAFYELGELIPRNKALSWLLLVLGSYLCSMPDSAQPLPWYPDRATLGGTMYWHEIGATALIMGLLGNPAAQRALSTRIPQFLGRISFTLYLIHLPLICGPISWLVIASRNLPYYPLIGLGFASTMALCIAAAAATTALVDDGPVRLSRRIQDMISGFLARKGALQPIFSPQPWPDDKSQANPRTDQSAPMGNQAAL